MTEAVIRGADPNDIRFQFEIIRQLAESVKVSADTMRGMQEDMRTLNTAQAKTNERLAAIEANRINETVAKMDVRVDTVAGRVDKLEQLEDRRAGETAVKAAFLKWWPVIGMVILVVWTIGRALGFFYLPEPPRTSVPPAILGTAK